MGKNELALIGEIEKTVSLLEEVRSFYVGIQQNELQQLGKTRATALIVFNFLHGKMQVSLPVVGSGPVYLVNITCNDPYYMGKDEKNRHVFITNTLIYREEL